MTTDLRRWWTWGVSEYESPRGPSHQMRSLLQGRRPESDSEVAMLDGYRARQAADHPVPQRQEYQDK